MIEVAQASVTIIPTMKGAQQTITKEMTSMTDTAAEKAGKSSGQKFSSKFGSAIKSGAKTIATAVTAAVGTVSALSASFYNAAKATAEFGDHIDKMSQKLGISTDAYQEWDFICQHSGTSMDSMKTAMTKLSTAAANGSDAFEKLGISAEEGDFVRAIAKPLIHDIIEKADAALQDGSERAADLRFGHDVGLLPLVGTIGIEGMQEHFPSENVHTHWFAFDMVPMASNLQMVFFRNKRGHVLVQLLYNERETSIPALPAATGKFYDWNVLRAYLKALETAIPDDNIVRDTEKKQRSGVA